MAFLNLACSQAESLLYGNTAGHKTVNAGAAPSWATICRHRMCRQRGGAFREVFSRPPRTAICLDSCPVPCPEHKSGLLLLNHAQIPMREDPRNHARYLPFDTDISHNSDPRGRGKKKASILLSTKRNGQTFTCKKSPLGFFFIVVVMLPVMSRNRWKHVCQPGREYKLKPPFCRAI